MTVSLINEPGLAVGMGHAVKVQVTERAKKGGRQYTMTIPRQIAELWNLKRGDELVLDQPLGTDTATLRKKQFEQKEEE